MTLRVVHLALAVALSVLASGSAEADGSTSTALNAIRFKMQTSNDAGLVLCGLFTERGWLKQPVQSARAAIHGKVALCIFNGIPKGVYGISAFHDENSNGKLDTNLVGYPMEEYCASRNARNVFSAPSFSDARFRYSGGTVELEARMK